MMGAYFYGRHSGPPLLERSCLRRQYAVFCFFHPVMNRILEPVADSWAVL
jgi:hypothetical protein